MQWIGGLRCRYLLLVEVMLRRLSRVITHHGRNQTLQKEYAKYDCVVDGLLMMMDDVRYLMCRLLMLWRGHYR